MNHGRIIEERVFRLLMTLCSLAIVIVLCMIFYSILRRGIPALSWEILTQTPKGGYYFGKEGGILNAIAGSFYLSIGATFLALLLSLPLALFMNLYLVSYTRFTELIRFMLDILWGVPSIVYGAFGFIIMIFLGMKASLLAAIITVSMFILPIMVRAMDEVFRTVPAGLKEAALSVGSTRSEMAYRVYIRQCFPGIITAVLLSFGRAVGDAASVLFTAGFTDRLPTSLLQPAATLPLAIFFQLGSPIPEVQNRAYAAAALLTVFILLISIISRWSIQKYHRSKINF